MGQQAHYPAELDLPKSKRSVADGRYDRRWPISQGGGP